MQCKNAREELIACRYAGTEPEAVVQEHLATCDVCRSELGRIEALDAVLAVDEDEEPRPGFDTRFFARLAQEKAVQKKGRLATWWRWGVGFAAAGAVAAGVLFAVGLESDAPPALDLALALDLELAENLDVLTRLEDLEAFEILSEVHINELEDILAAPEDSP